MLDAERPGFVPRISQGEILRMMHVLEASRPAARLVSLVLLLVLGGAAPSVTTAVTDDLFLKPFGMDVDESGTLYVADIEANEIVVLRPDFTVERRIRSLEGYGALTKPFDVKRRGGRFYIVDNGRSNVLIVDDEWRLVRQIGIGTPGAEPGHFSEPHALTVMPSGEIVVADTQNHRIQRFDPDGRFVGSIDSTVIGGDLPMLLPTGVASLPDGQLVVSEYGDHPPLILGPDYRIAARLPPMGMAYGVATDGRRIAIVATYANQVAVFTAMGQPLFELQSSDSSNDGEFNKPGGIAFAPDGRLIVAEWRNRRLQVFSPEGKHLRTIGGVRHETGRAYAAHPRRFPDEPPLLAAFTRVLDPMGVRSYHEAGVTKLYLQPAENLHQPAVRTAVEAAHAVGMKADIVFDTYMHGARPGPDGDVSAFAQANPRYFTLKRDGRTANRSVLSYAYPEVRRWKVAQVVAALESSGADGVVMDYIRWPAGNTDGYDEPALAEFRQLYGEDAREVDPLDPRWVKLRASYISRLLEELHAAIDAMPRRVTVGVYVDADPEAELAAVGRSWPHWSAQGWVDATHHMLYTDDFDQLYRSVRVGVERTPPQIRVVSCIDIYAGYLTTPELLREGIRVSLLAGADEVVIVRDPLERPGMSETLRKISDEFVPPPGG